MEKHAVKTRVVAPVALVGDIQGSPNDKALTCFLSFSPTPLAFSHLIASFLRTSHF